METGVIQRSKEPKLSHHNLGVNNRVALSSGQAAVGIPSGARTGHSLTLGVRDYSPP